MDSRSSPLLVNLGLGVSPPRSKNEKSITSSTLVTPVRQTCQTVEKRVCCEKQAAAWSLTASVVNYLCFAVTAGVVNGDGYCCKLFDMNTYRVFCILYLKIHCQKYLLQLWWRRSDRHVGIYASPGNCRTCYFIVLHIHGCIYMSIFTASCFYFIVCISSCICSVTARHNKQMYV